MSSVISENSGAQDTANVLFGHPLATPTLISGSKSENANGAILAQFQRSGETAGELLDFAVGSSALILIVLRRLAAN